MSTQVAEQPFWEKFGLHRHPFDADVAITTFISHQWQQHLEFVQHISSFNQVLLSIIGDSGVGKTQFLRFLRQHLDEHFIIHSASGEQLANPEQLVHVFNQTFGADVKLDGRELFKQFQQQLQQLGEQQKKCLLLVDDAHELPHNVLATLHYLVKAQSDSIAAIHVVLLGQPSLEAQLQEIAKQQGGDDFLYTIKMEGFSLTETRNYLLHCFQAAGLKGELPLDAAIIRKIYEESGGMPNQVNKATEAKMKQKKTPQKDGKLASALGGLMPMIMAHKIKLISIFLIVVVLPPVMYYYNNNIQTSVRGEAKQPLALPSNSASTSDDMMRAQIHQNLQKQNNNAKTSKETDQDLAARLQKAEQQLLGNQTTTKTKKTATNTTSNSVPVSQSANVTQNRVAVNNNAQSAQSQNKSSLPVQGIDASTNQVQSAAANGDDHTTQATNQLLAATSSNAMINTQNQQVKQTPIPAAKPKQIPISKLTLVTPTQPAATDSNPAPAASSSAVLVTPTKPAVVKVDKEQTPTTIKVAAKPAVKQAPIASTASARTAMEKQLLNANGKHYTLQLIGVSHPNSLANFVTANKLNREKVKFYQTKLRGKNWYVLVYGQYPSRTAAMNAIKTLPSNIQKQKPWARSLSSVQKDIKK